MAEGLHTVPVWMRQWIRELLARTKQDGDGELETLPKRLNDQAETVFRKAGLSISEPPVFPDPDDPDGQTLLIRYPCSSLG